MAKSKKALKALKRRKEAQKRSRVVKERQDYTGGGRVKAFTGINIGQDQIESATKAAEEYQKKQQEEAQANQNQGNQNQGTQDQGTQDQGTSTEDNALAARRAELQRLGTIGMDTDGDGIISQAERNKALGVTPSKTPEQLKADADAKAKAKADAEAKAKADAKAREQAILAEQAKLDEQARIDEQALKRWETPSVAAKAAETTVDPSSFATVQDLISEGEIEGFASASKAQLTKGTTAYDNASQKDIFLDDTPLSVQSIPSSLYIFICNPIIVSPLHNVCL